MWPAPSAWAGIQVVAAERCGLVFIAHMVLGVDKLIALHQQKLAYTGVGEYPGYAWLL